MAGKRGFGSVRKLPSGRYQARYTGPDTVVYKAPRTFAAKVDAEGWIGQERRKIDLGTWRPPTAEAARGVTVKTYAEKWIGQRDLKPRTESLYRDLLRLHIVPVLGDVELAKVTPSQVREWHAGLQTGATRKTHAYQLLHAVFRTALTDEVIDANPCRLEGAMHTRRKREPVVLDAKELAALADALGPRWGMSALLMGWCGLRRGELFELRRGDVDLKAGTISVTRAVTYRDGQWRVDTPKTAAGTRTVVIPPHIVPDLKKFMRKHVGKGQDALLFASEGNEHVGEWEYRRVFNPAREKIGKPDLRVHDLRHAGAVLAAHAGATVAELMGRIGHTTPEMALRYQHIAAGRDAEIARRMSEAAKA